MNSETLQQQPILRLAIPYYGRLFRPGRGQERIYFQVDVTGAPPEQLKMSLQVWDPRNAGGFAAWLKGRGISGLLCRDSHPPLETPLQAAGIWTRWGEDGDVAEMVQRCVALAGADGQGGRS